MSETKLEALEWRWRISQSVDDELEYLRARARCGEPRRRRVDDDQDGLVDAEDPGCAT